MNGLTVLVALGANLPSDLGVNARPPADTLVSALTSLNTHGLRHRAVSRFFITPCFPAGAGPDYVNAAAVFDSPQGWSAQDVLALLHRVEAAHGRTRQTRWAGRVLDLDLLAVGDLVLPDGPTHAHWRGLAPVDQARLTPAELILPHPRIADRGFVLVPLADVAADWCHPVTGQSVRQMLAALPAAEIGPIRAMTRQGRTFTPI